MADGDVSHSLISVFGGMALIALPLVPGIVRHTWTPDGRGMAGVAILTLAGPLLAAALDRLLRPHVTIYESIDTGERFPVERSPQTRRRHVAIALGFYVLGAVLTAL